MIDQRCLFVSTFVFCNFLPVSSPPFLFEVNISPICFLGVVLSKDHTSIHCHPNVASIIFRSCLTISLQVFFGLSSFLLTSTSIYSASSTHHIKLHHVQTMETSSVLIFSQNRSSHAHLLVSSAIIYAKSPPATVLAFFCRTF